MVWTSCKKITVLSNRPGCFWATSFWSLQLRAAQVFRAKWPLEHKKKNLSLPCLSCNIQTPSKQQTQHPNILSGVLLLPGCCHCYSPLFLFWWNSEQFCLEGWWDSDMIHPEEACAEQVSLTSISWLTGCLCTWAISTQKGVIRGRGLLAFLCFTSV